VDAADPRRRSPWRDGPCAPPPPPPADANYPMPPSATPPASGNPACWSGAYNAARCCAGTAGDASCWSGRYTFQFCCNGNGH
jgi:hypothetical protein